MNFRDGEFKVVGHWEQGATPEETVQSDTAALAALLEDCSHGHCGHLVITEEIRWMGKVYSRPSDRTLTHSSIHAQYFTLVLVFLILAIAGGNGLELIHFHCEMHPRKLSTHHTMLRSLECPEVRGD